MGSEELKTEVDKIMMDLEGHLSSGDNTAATSAIDEAIGKLQNLKDCLSGGT